MLPLYQISLKCSIKDTFFIGTVCISQKVLFILLNGKTTFKNCQWQPGEGKVQKLKISLKSISYL